VHQHALLQRLAYSLWRRPVHRAVYALSAFVLARRTWRLGSML
jgi:hypothetical protein